jgi:hypothetical protein
MKLWFCLLALVALFAPLSCLAVEADTKQTVPTIRLYSKYDADGTTTMEYSRVNGPYYLYMAAGDKFHVIAVTDSTDKSLRLRMTGPDNLVCTAELPRMDVDIPKIGQYHFQLMKGLKPVGEDVRLDVIDKQQTPWIEGYVQTIRGVVTGKDQISTEVVCTVINNFKEKIDIGITIKRMTDARVDFQLASRVQCFGGNQGALGSGQEFMPGSAQMWRSSTSKRLDLTDAINKDQYFVSIEPGETICFTCRFEKPDK